MKAHEVVASVVQFPVSLDIHRNLDTIRSVTGVAERGSLVVLPEGALSGYAQDPAFVRGIDLELIENSLHVLQSDVVRRGIHLVFGSCLAEAGRWFNAGIYLGPQGRRFDYRKVNLATSERSIFTAGDEIAPFDCVFDGRPVRVGIQICREVRFPEQWQYLARRGAQVLLHLNNAVGDRSQAAVWRSHLVSRAAENQRFLLSANNADPEQKCPSMIAMPDGQVAWESLCSSVAIGRARLDLSRVADWYLSQSRRDLILG